MKTSRQLLFCLLILSGAVSCQKQYERPDVDLGAGGSAGGGTSNGTLLVRAEYKTTGNTTEGGINTYDYDANNRLILAKIASTDSSNRTQTVAYRYERDATGKVTRIISNLFSATQPGAGFPDSVYMDVHYPTGSTNFDYVKYKMNFGGLDYMDSVAYTWTNGTVSATVEFTGFSGTGIPPMVTGAATQYAYVNGNVSTMKFYDVLPITTPDAIYTIEYDTKNQALAVGTDAFLPGLGPGCVSKNNSLKETYSDKAGAALLQVNYTLQYNATNYPITGAMVQTVPVAKTQNLKFFYK
jgi:hypothetical protein